MTLPSLFLPLDVNRYLPHNLLLPFLKRIKFNEVFERLHIQERENVNNYTNFLYSYYPIKSLGKLPIF